MADAQLTKKPNGKWEVRWRARDGRRRGRTFETRTTAEAFVDGLRREQALRGEGTVPSVTVETFVKEKWWPGVEDRTARSTRATWESVARNHILPRIGTMRMAGVLVEDLDDLYRSSASAGASHGTLTKIRSVLSNIWSEARRLGYASDNPVALSRLPIRKAPRNDEVVLTLDEAMQLADQASEIWPGYRGVILVAAGAGLRWGEVAALTPADVDLDSGLIRVNKALSEVAGEFEVKEPKTRSSRRVAVFHSDIGRALHDHVAEHALPDVLFPSPGGGWLRRSNFRRRVWKPSLDRAGLDTGFTFHSLRSSYATMLAEFGATPRSIADLLGHSKVSTTLDIYTSRFDGQAHRMAELMGHRRLRVVDG